MTQPTPTPDKPATKPLKAYEVREGHEGECCIVFASSGIAARRQGAVDLDIDFESVESCRRAAWADSYCPGPVPAQACIEAGWWYECACGCSRRIDSDGGRALDDSDASDNPLDPIFQSGRVYWNQRCIDREVEHQRAAEQQKHSDTDTATRALLEKFPFATDIDVFRTSKDLVATFCFPDAAYRAIWAIGAMEVTVHRADRTAWEAAMKTGKTAAG